MWRNQYLVFSGVASAPEDFLRHDFHGLTICAHPSLNVSVARGAASVALIGYALAPLAPKQSNDEIANGLAECADLHAFFRQSQTLSGRHVLIYRNGSQCIATADACHLRQLHFGDVDGHIALTSSPKLFLWAHKLEHQASEEKQAILADPQFQKKECAWFGDECLEDRLGKVLPNHYLAVPTRTVGRRPLYATGIETPAEAANFSIDILRGTFEALSLRHRIIQPLTAGWDTRMLLAASREWAGVIDYYVGDLGHGADVRIASNLSKRLGLRFEIVKQPLLRDDVRQAFREEHLAPRWSKAPAIQWHLDQQRSPDTINVLGTTAEIARCFYGRSRGSVGLGTLLSCSEYGQRHPYFARKLDEWRVDAVGYAREHNIPLLDLFYWEQRMGNWCAMGPHEQDLALEEISPFNNRSLLFTLLTAVPPINRSAPSYPFFRDLVERMWPEALREPVNPHENAIKRVLKGSATVQRWGRAMRRIVRND